MTKRQLQQRIKERKKQVFLFQFNSSIPQINLSSLSTILEKPILSNPATRLKFIFVGITAMCTIIHVVSTIYISLLGAAYANTDSERRVLSDQKKTMTTVLAQKESLTEMRNDASEYGFYATGKKIVLKPEGGLASR